MNDLLKGLIELRDYYDKALEKAKLAEKEADKKCYYNQRQKEITKIAAFNDFINSLDRIIEHKQKQEDVATISKTCMADAFNTSCIDMTYKKLLNQLSKAKVIQITFNTDADSVFIQSLIKDNYTEITALEKPAEIQKWRKEHGAPRISDSLTNIAKLRYIWSEDKEYYMIQLSLNDDNTFDIYIVREPDYNIT